MKKVLLGAGGALLLLVIIGAISGGSKNPKPVITKSGSPVASPRTSPSPASPRPPISTQLTAARSTLRTEDQHFRDLLIEGQQILGTAQYDSLAALTAIESDPNSPPARFAAYRQNPNPENDTTFQGAFTQADAAFNADNEPPAIGAWRDDASQAQSDLGAWVRVAAGWEVRMKTSADLTSAANLVLADLVRADTDADAVGRG